MRSLSRPALLALTWTLAFALVAGSVAAASVLTDDATEHEQAAISLLDELADAPPGAARIVILGDSLARSAFNHRPNLEASLQAAGVDARVVNLADSGRDLASFEPLFDAIFESQPDVVVVQIDTVANYRNPQPAVGLRTRVERLMPWYTRPDLFDPLCRPKSPEQLAGSIGRVRRIFGKVPNPRIAQEFTRRAADEGTEVFLAGLPRSRPILDEVGETLDAFSAAVGEQLGTLDNVTLGHTVVIPGAARYCDYVHLNRAGQALFLERWVPEFVVYLEGLES